MPKDWTFKFTSLQATRGLKQLKLVDKLDKDKINNVNLFREFLTDNNLYVLPKELEGSKNVYWQYPMYVNNVDKFIEYLKENDIDMGLTNLSLCSHLDIYPQFVKETTNALKIKNHYLFVPTYQGLSREKIEYISIIIKDFLEENR
jgi:dTDP-4-amino-4,6-dideoxygalactose transaminase